MNFSRTDLRRVNLKGAKLREANLQGANLRSANLEGANLQRANLRNVNGLTTSQVKAASKWNLAFYDDEFLKRYGNELGLPQSEKEHSLNVRKRVPEPGWAALMGRKEPRKGPPKGVISNKWYIVSLIFDLLGDGDNGW